MELKDALSVFKRRVGKKVIAYEDRGDSFIIITDTKGTGSLDSNYYIVTPFDISVTNPILCQLNADKVRRL